MGPAPPCPARRTHSVASTLGPRAASSSTHRHRTRITSGCMTIMTRATRQRTPTNQCRPRARSRREPDPDPAAAPREAPEPFFFVITSILPRDQTLDHPTGTFHRTSHEAESSCRTDYRPQEGTRDRGPGNSVKVLATRDAHQAREVARGRPRGTASQPRSRVDGIADPLGVREHARLRQRCHHVQSCQNMSSHAKTRTNAHGRRRATMRDGARSTTNSPAAVAPPSARPVSGIPVHRAPPGTLPLGRLPAVAFRCFSRSWSLRASRTSRTRGAFTAP